MSFSMNNDLNSFFRLLDANPALLHRERNAPASSQTSRRAFSPNFDVHEMEHEYVLEGELPGMSDKSKVHLEFTEAQTLLIRGKIERSTHASDHKPTVEEVPDDDDKTVAKKSSETAEKKDTRPKYWVSERTIGEFQRTFSFPGSVDIDKVHASLAHGILKVVVPKREKPVGRRIEIH